MALVITIIILLILAGISIAGLTQTGLFGKAQQAKNDTENAQITENAILENYLLQINEITGGSTTDGGTTPTPTITWAWEDTDNNGTKSIGDIVTDSTGEKFYIISTEGENYALLAEKNLDTNTMKQSDSANIIVFSSTNYWTSIDGITYPYDINNTATSSDIDAIAKARVYGTSKGGIGRLMTVEEVVAFGGDKDEFDISACPAWIKTSNYWLGSAYDSDNVYFVNGEFGAFREAYFWDDVGGFGVRPVIEISKSKIS